MIKALGDSALLVQLGDQIDMTINRRVHALDAFLQTKHIPGILEIVPSYCTLVIHYDPLILTFQRAAEWVEGEMSAAPKSVYRSPRKIEVPVHYGEARGVDLDAVAALKGISAAEVVRIHSEHEYTVYMMGFMPGFAYMGKLDERLVMPRLQTPRTTVQAGSVAIAGSQTGIYPLDSPGGWHLIGWTPLQLFDPKNERPFLFAPGDTVKFIAEA